MTDITRGMAALAVLAISCTGCGTSSTAEKRDKAEFHYKLANGHFYASEIVPAIAELKACMKFEPDHPDAHHLMGFIMFGRKEYARAERHFRKALEVRSGFHEARGNLGALLLQTRRYRDAIEVLMPLTEATLYRTPAVAHNNLGLANQHLGRLRKAMQHFKMAVFHNPKFCVAYTNMGVLQLKLDRKTDAQQWLEQATSRCKKYPEPHFHLGELFIKQRQTTLARAQYLECFQDGPETQVGRMCKRKVF